MSARDGKCTHCGAKVNTPNNKGVGSIKGIAGMEFICGKCYKENSPKHPGKASFKKSG